MKKPARGTTLLRRCLVVTLMAGCLTGIGAVGAPSAHAATFVVNSTADPGNGICDVAECTMREALNAAFASSGEDTISFNIAGSGVHTITAAGDFPSGNSDGALTIDGSTQPGYTGTPLIELNGANSFKVGISGTHMPLTVRGLAINRFSGFGVHIVGSGSNGSLVEDNFIGTDPSGTIDLGGTISGIQIQGSGNNTIRNNLISGNAANGIVMIMGVEACSVLVNNTIQGNKIGTDVTGTLAVPNNSNGIDIAGGNGGHTIGGTAAGDANVIAFQGIRGVVMQPGPCTTTGISVRGNSIHTNSNLGIDLIPVTVTPNDTDDVDTGVNGLQNFPVITDVSRTPTDTTITGTLNSTPSSNYALDFFSSPACDTTGLGGFGEGATYLGSHSVTTDAGGDAVFTKTIATAVPADHLVTATATNTATDDSSEFSACFTVPEPEQAPRSVTLVPSRPIVKFGAPLTLSGQVSSAAAECRDSVAVDIFRDVSGGGAEFVFYDDAVTDSSGNFSITNDADKNATYEARLDETQQCLSNLSDRVLVEVRKKVTINVSDTTLLRGQTLKVNAAVTPCAGHAGEVLKLVKIVLNGRGQLLDESTTNDACRAVFRVSFGVNGEKNLRVVSPQQDEDHLGGKSRIVDVFVTRR